MKAKLYPAREVIKNGVPRSTFGRKVKQSRNRPSVAQRVPGVLGSQTS